MEDNNLKRELGLTAATAIVVGNMMGSGIFTSPQSLAQVANPTTTILAWIITGIGSVLLALSFANLGTKYPATGGPIVYTHKAFGEFTAFLVAWTFWIGSWIGNAAIITAIIRYLTPFFPILSSNGLIAFLVSSAFLWIMTYINYKGVKEAGIIGIITTTLKLLVILVFLIIAVIGFNPEYLKTYSSSEVTGLGSLAPAIAVTLWSFVGLESAVVSGGEIKNPEVNIRRSTVIGTIFASIIYLLLSILAMGGLSQADLASSNAPLSSIINNLNMGFSINIFNKSIAIKNISNGDILMKGSIKEVGGYIENVKRNNSIKDIVNILDRIEFKILGENSGFSNKVLNSNIPDFAINVINEFEWVLNF